MNHVLRYSFTGVCSDIDLYEELESGEIVITECLEDVLPYFYEKHFNIPYRELAWYLIPGAKEFVKELEDKWMHNQLDLSEVYKDKSFLESLAEKYAYKVNEDTIDEMRDEFEDVLHDALYDLDQDELKELYEWDDEVRYSIEDSNGNEVASGYVSLPDLEDEEDD